MPVECPHCGSRFLKPSEPRNSKEKKLWLRLKTMLRCLDCKARFTGPTVILSDLKYARCPRCERFDLNGWTGRTYTPEFFWTGFKLHFGGTRFRCEYCRINFSSFRRRKEVFTFKRWKNLAQERPVPMPPAETPAQAQPPVTASRRVSED